MRWIFVLCGSLISSGLVLGASWGLKVALGIDVAQMAFGGVLANALGDFAAELLLALLAAPLGILWTRRDTISRFLRRLAVGLTTIIGLSILVGLLIYLARLLLQTSPATKGIVAIAISLFFLILAVVGAVHLVRWYLWFRQRDDDDEMDWEEYVEELIEFETEWF